MNIVDLISKLPKIELHCHLDGSVRPETVLEIANKENVALPSKDILQLEKYLKVQDECTSLKDYLKKFDLVLKVMQKPEYLYRITLELLEDSYKANIKYIEIRFSTELFINEKMDFHEAVKSIIAAVDEGKKRFGILAKLILICMRHHSLETNIAVVEQGKSYLDKGIVAVDLAGNEHDYPPELHREVFRKAKYYGYHITIHAGETGICKNIKTSVNELYAERIGHGVYAFKDESTIKLLKDKNIALEMCVTSNVHTKAVEDFKSHPIKQYLDKGIKVTVNTDNNTVSNTNLIKEYELLMKYQDFTVDDLKTIIFNGIDASFAKQHEKDYLSNICKKELSSLGY